jgi:hypothetical protein
MRPYACTCHWTDRKARWPLPVICMRLHAHTACAERARKWRVALTSGAVVLVAGVVLLIGGR